MQTIDQRFLSNLKQKLSVGNRRSIYLNVLPKRYLTRLDFADLEVLSEGLTTDFINTLLSKPAFAFKITPNSTTNDQEQLQQKRVLRRLSSISIENEDHFAEHGVKTFGFGYPILLMRDSEDPQKIIKAPLMVWSLDIERNFQRANEWVIKKKEDYAVTTNIVLASYLANQIKVHLKPIYDPMIEDAVLDKDELAQMTFEQMRQLTPTISQRTQQLFRDLLDQPPQAVKSQKEIEALPLETPAILWSGVFGLFRSQKESILKDIDYFIENSDPLNQKIKALHDRLPKGDSAFMKHSFTVVDTDPSQQQLLHHLDKGKNLIIQGPPGTGKSQTLTGIIANTISNAGTCLIVCEKKTALDVIYNNLKELGLGELAVIIEDIYRDRGDVVDSVRARSKHHHRVYQPSPTFIRLLKSCSSHVKKLQGFHNKLQAPISGDFNWPSVVGQFLVANKLADHSILDNELSASQFEFTLTEYEQVCSILSEGEQLYKALGTLNHPLNALHDRFFKQANVTQVEADIKDALKDLTFVVNSAQRDMLSYLFEYEELLEKHFNDVYLKKMKLVDHAVDLIEAGFKKSKYYFNKNKGIFRQFLKSVSATYKELEADKVEVLETFFRIKKVHNHYQYFRFNFMDVSDYKDMKFEDLKDHLEDYRTAVYDWHDARGPVIRELVKDLGPTNIYQYVDFNKKVKEVSRNLDAFERNFEQSKVFKVSFKFVSRKIHKRHKQLEGLQQNLEKLNKQFDNFADYHALKYFWLSLNDAQRLTIQGLAAEDPQDWDSAFSSWYLNALLAHHEDEFVPNEHLYNLTRKSFAQELANFQKMLVSHTLKFWRGEQTRLVQTFHKEQAPLKLHSLFNKRGSAGERRTSLRQIISVAPKLFKGFFPVLFVSPSVCSSILPLTPGLFDVVIFDEASQLRLEDTFCALTRGKYKVISGDSQQMPPSDYFQSAKTIINEDLLVEDDELWDEATLINESIDYLSSSESLLEFGLAEGYYQESFLEVHYRSRHPYLIDFSNAAFYGNRLTPMPAAQDYCPIEFVEVGGTYAQHCNEEEAEAVIEELLQIAQQKGTCPSVGVATFNLHQRNLILEKIQERAVQNPSEGSLLQKLFTHGLFVKNLENIQGDERDVLLLSTTFGKRPDGSFLQHFGPINRKNGYRLLNVIITRSKQRIKIFCSIPPEYYQDFRAAIRKKGNNGKGIFYAYLVYAKAVSAGDDNTRKAILQLVFDHCRQKPLDDLMYSFNDSSFRREVIAFLQKELPEVKMEENYQHAGFQLPIAFFDEAGTLKAAFYYDIYHKQHSEEAYAWDKFYEDRLAEMNIQTYRIWSKEWWEDSQEAQQKLLTQIKDCLEK